MMVLAIFIASCTSHKSKLPIEAEKQTPITS